jgi:tetratricopeptide (TPR) repeat protein
VLLLWALLVLAPDGAQNNVDGRAALERAAALAQQGKLADADAQAQVALTDPDTRAAANSVLGTIRFQQHRFEDSARYLEEAIRLQPRLLGAHLTLAQIYAIQGQNGRALAVFKQAFTLDPGNEPARLALVQAAVEFGLLLTKTGAHAEAIEVLERARQAGPPSYELAFNLGSAYLLDKQSGRALDAYDAALALRPDSIQALQQAAAVAEHNGELERSLSYWIRARKLMPDSPEILLGFGRVCLRMDLLEDAEPALTRAATLKPDEPSYQYTLAAARVGKHDFEAAQTLLQRLVDRQPTDPQLQYALGAVHYVQGHLDDAAAHLRESVRLQPAQLSSPYYLALIARDKGEADRAIDALQTLLQRYPDHSASCEVLGGLLMTARRYPEAEEQLRKAIRLEPASVKANYQLGLLLARMGRKEESDKQLALANSLRKEQQASSRLQLRLLDPDQVVDRNP